MRLPRVLYPRRGLITAIYFRAVCCTARRCPRTTRNIILQISLHGRVERLLYVTSCVRCRSTENSTSTCMRVADARYLPTRMWCARRVCAYAMFLDNDRSSRTPGIRPDDMRELHREKERNRGTSRLRPHSHYFHDVWKIFRRITQAAHG